VCLTLLENLRFITYLLHSSLASAYRLGCAFYQPQQTEQIMQEKNYFPQPSRHVLTFLHPILIRWSHTEHQWGCSWSVSINTQSVTCKSISHLQVLVTNFFSTPTHKTETTSRWETTNSNPLDQIKLSTQLETGNSQ